MQSLPAIMASYEALAQSAARPVPMAASMDALGVQGVPLGFDRNEEIFGEGEPANCVYRVLQGVVRTHRILSDGRRQITDFYLPGDVFGLQDGEGYSTSAEAVTPCQVLAMRRAVLTGKAARDPLTAQKLWNLALHRLRRTEEHMMVLGRKGANERVAWFLLDMSERIPAPDRVELPMSRQDMADFLGLTIETVSRTMTVLQEDDLISLPSYRNVTLNDRQALLDLAA